jgi:hypothetical protein
MSTSPNFSFRRHGLSAVKSHPGHWLENSGNFSTRFGNGRILRTNQKIIMALIKCHECEHQVSDKAVACPKCGAPVQNAEPPSLDEEYLKKLQECENHAIDQYDKTLLTLAAGAFGVAIAFLKDIVKSDTVHSKDWLICAWIGWGGALSLSLTAFYLSHKAMGHAQKQYRDGVRDNLGGCYDLIVRKINPIAGLSFLFGLLSMLVFVTNNLGYENTISNKFTTTVTTITTVATDAITTTNATRATDTATTATKQDSKQTTAAK